MPRSPEPLSLFERIEVKVYAMYFGLSGPSRPLPHFDGLVNAEDLFDTGEPPYPVERTLLTPGALALAFKSKKKGGSAVNRPQLAISYKAPSPCTHLSSGPKRYGYSRPNNGSRTRLNWKRAGFTAVAPGESTTMMWAATGSYAALGAMVPLATRMRCRSG